MSNGGENRRSRRFWAMMLPVPLLRAALAYALFALLHLWIGLPWPAAEGAGIVGLLLELISLLLLVVAVDLYVVGRLYRIDFFKSWLLNEKLETVFLAPFAVILSSIAGYFAVLAIALLFSAQKLASPQSGGLLPLVALAVTAIAFVQIVALGEREKAEAEENYSAGPWR